MKPKTNVFVVFWLIGMISSLLVLLYVNKIVGIIGLVFFNILILYVLYKYSFLIVIHSHKYGLLNKKFFESKSKGYMNEDNRWKIARKTIIELVNPKKGEKILDIACGYGFSSIECAVKGADVTSLDISKTALEWTKRIGKKKGVNLKIIESDAVSLKGVEEKNFDKAIYANITEHLLNEDTLKSFKNCNKILKDKGYVFIYCPNGNHYSEYIRLKPIEGHIGLKSMEELVDLLEKADFDIVKKYYKPGAVPILKELDILFQDYIPIFRKRLCIVARKR
ncbi:MAG: class I SAM-dependent methyltransferase [archaeon]